MFLGFELDILAMEVRLPPEKLAELKESVQLKGKVGRASHMWRLNASIKSDIQWWATFLRGWNWISMLRDQMREQSPNHVWMDASGSFGCGAWGQLGLQ